MTVGYANNSGNAYEVRGNEGANGENAEVSVDNPGRISPVRGVEEEMECSVDHAVDGGSDTHRIGEQEGTGSKHDAWMVVVVKVE